MHGKNVTLDQVSMKFDQFTAVQPTDLEIKAGEFFSILGPSGCGKTTILRLLSGFLNPTTGSVSIGGDLMNGIGPNKRSTALIFQNLALFPMMPVWENVAFGLEARGIAKALRRKKAYELLEMVELSRQAEKIPSELSGGQRQRVAIARALAVEPSVLLLDEPLSALDLKLRQHMRAELKDIQRKTGVTFIYITHDQGEALTMSDRIAVMNEGRLEQVATTHEIYNHPKTPFVATFVGENNVFKGKVTAKADGIAQIETELGLLRGLNKSDLGIGEDAMLFIRPERISPKTPKMADENNFTANVLRHDLEGPFINVFMEANGHEVLMHLTNAGDASSDFQGNIELAFDPQEATIIKAGSLARE